MPMNASSEFARRYGMSVGEAYELLYPRARYLTRGRREEANDLLHDFLVEKLGRVTAAAPPEKPAAFLRRSLALFFIDRLRREARHLREIPWSVPPETAGTAVPAPAPRSLLWDWMVSVVPEDADLVWRHAIDGETQSELARRTGIPPATVGDRIRRAVRRLRENWEEDR